MSWAWNVRLIFRFGHRDEWAVTIFANFHFAKFSVHFNDVKRLVLLHGTDNTFARFWWFNLKWKFRYENTVPWQFIIQFVDGILYTLWSSALSTDRISLSTKMLPSRTNIRWNWSTKSFSVQLSLTPLGSIHRPSGHTIQHLSIRMIAYWFHPQRKYIHLVALQRVCSTQLSSASMFSTFPFPRFRFHVESVNKECRWCHLSFE